MYPLYLKLNFETENGKRPLTPFSTFHKIIFEMKGHVLMPARATKLTKTSIDNDNIVTILNL